MSKEELHKMLAKDGYRELREVPGRGLCGIFPFMFTTGLVYGIDAYGYRGRYCYAHSDALRCLAELHAWSGESHPAGPWIKHKGHGIDESNPANPLQP